MEYIEKIADALARAYRAGRIGLNELRHAARGQRPRFIETIGQGMEGIAQLRTHPTQGVQVAKIYDKQSPWYSPQMFDRKTEILRRLTRKFPKQVAKRFGIDAERKIHFTQYIADNNKDMSPESLLKVTKQNDIRDLFPQNIKGGKIVDFLPKDEAILRTTPIVAAGNHMENLEKSIWAREHDVGDTADRIREKTLNRYNKLADRVEEMMFGPLKQEIKYNPKGRIDRVLRQAYGKDKL